MPETELQKVLIKNYKADILAFMEGHPGAFEEAIGLALDDESSFAWRASWILWSCMEHNDERLRPFVPDFLRKLPGVKENCQREWLIILQRMDIAEEYEGLLLDHCIRIWETIGKKPGVRLHAFRMIAKFAESYPDLSNELAFLSQEQYLEGLSPGVRWIVSKMIQKWKRKQDMPLSP